MQCLKCQFENPTGINFCGECGAKLERVCPGCNSPNPLNFKFCGECGHNLIPVKEISEQKSEAKNLKPRPSAKKSFSDVALLGGERKHVTVLFSDFTGYTAMSEKLDPEEVKEITSRIFGEISKIVANYDGFIEKYAGDAVMAIFGVPQAHEDDPIRAIKAAREIHQLVDTISPEVEKKIGQPISMHTGINTGHRLSGLRSDLVGRKVEMAELSEAIDNLRQGKGRVFSICGAAGTGKSRLVEEFKAGLDLEQIQWIEGHAYAYSQDIPYLKQANEALDSLR
jgi:hypothetical protein